MELSDLKLNRRRVPGIIFVTFSVPGYFGLTGELNLELLGQAVVAPLTLVFTYFIGTVFNALQIRSIVTRHSWERISENIYQGLLDNGLKIDVEKRQIDAIKKSGKLMNIFYHFVDKDASLSNKAKVVMDNGLTWSTAADFFLLSGFFAVVYGAWIAFFSAPEFIFYSLIAIICIGLFSRFVVFRMAVNQHIKLGNDQIDYIATIYNKELEGLITDVFTDSGKN